MSIEISGGQSVSEPVSMAVVDAVAAAEGIQPADLDVRLGDFVDPEALDALASNSSVTWQLDFEVGDHRVELGSDGTILVDGQPEGQYSLDG